jgi:hypothetical protein
VRPSWADPVGWAGLGKVAPNERVEKEYLQARGTQIDERLSQLDQEIAAGRRELGMAAAGQVPAAPEVRALASDERALVALQLEAVSLRDERQRLAGELETGGTSSDPRAHLTHRSLPLAPARKIRGRLLAFWAVLSTPFILFAIGRVIHPSVGVTGTATALAWIVLLLGVESAIRGRFVAFLIRLVVVTAVVLAVLSFGQEWRLLLSWTFWVAALFVLLASIREAVRR